MKPVILTICTFLCLNLALTAKPQRMLKPTATGGWAAAHWLALLDSGRYGASWDQAGKTFQSRVTKAEWIAGMRKIRALYGKVLSRKFEGVKYAVNPPGVGPREHETLQFTINLARRGQAAEVVSMVMRKNGEWRVSSYYVVPLYRAL